MSLLIHLAFLIKINSKSAKDDDEQGGAEKKPTSIKFTPEEIVSKGNSGAKMPCSDWFGGIGFTWSFNSYGKILIAKVYQGYPAYRNGLKPGDEISDKDLDKIRGDPGTTVTFSVLRDGKRIDFVMKRERICTND